VTIEIGIIIALLTGSVAAGTFLLARMKDATESGRRDATIDARLASLRADVDELKKRTMTPDDAARLMGQAQGGIRHEVQGELKRGLEVLELKVDRRLDRLHSSLQSVAATGKTLTGLTEVYRAKTGEVPVDDDDPKPPKRR